MAPGAHKLVLRNIRLGAACAGIGHFIHDFRVLFNSYYQTRSATGIRGPQRGLLTRPTLDEVLAYRGHVDAQMLALLQQAATTSNGDIVELGLQHEQQHQELILTDVKHMLSCNPLHPAYRELPARSSGGIRAAALAELR